MVRIKPNFQIVCIIQCCIDLNTKMIQYKIFLKVLTPKKPNSIFCSTSPKRVILKYLTVLGAGGFFKICQNQSYFHGF